MICKTGGMSSRSVSDPQYCWLASYTTVHSWSSLLYLWAPEDAPVDGIGAVVGGDEVEERGASWLGVGGRVLATGYTGALESSVIRIALRT